MSDFVRIATCFFDNFCFTVGIFGRHLAIYVHWRVGLEREGSYQQSKNV